MSATDGRTVKAMSTLHVEPLVAGVLAAPALAVATVTGAGLVRMIDVANTQHDTRLRGSHVMAAGPWSEYEFTS